MIADSLRTGIAQGRFRPDTDVEAHTARLVAVIDGLQQQWLVDPEAVDMAAVFRGFLRETLAQISV